MDQEKLGDEIMGKAGSKQSRQRIMKLKTKEPERVKKIFRESI
jgi:hypothetical protein